MAQLSEFQQQNLGTGNFQNPNAQYYLSLLITPENALPNNWELNQHKPLISNIPSTTVTNDKLLTVIFPFELEETTPVLLFGATFNTKPITTMYTDTKVDDCRVDCATSACIITANGTTKTPIGEIDDFPFEVNKMTKTNAILDWTIQKLQLSQNSQHTCVPTTCGYFKPANMPAPLIEFEKEKEKPT
ncbi:hypothetical protein G9A89_018823 [Geosiphon pyriformis]|nr:hypothetical protein G9A89_018823 [Geosiphon pyriformis]